LIEAKTSRLIAFDAAHLARSAGNIMSVNIVLLGALCQTGILPLSEDIIRQAIQTRTKSAFVETNLKAFELGYQAATG
jgi:indolepyruvate ferredoxin oxidoreductase beta subunit